jgi:DNA-binding response OmpR family regulator
LLHRILNSSSEKACAGTAILSIMHILLVEDDHKAARLLARGLEEEGYAVTVAHSAEEASHHALSRFDMAILDWMMPGKDGVTVCTEWRADGQTLPVLMLTARDAVADRITGLNTGADDYLTKPFVFDELLARVRALLRRVERVRRRPRCRWPTCCSICAAAPSHGQAPNWISRPRNTPSSNCSCNIRARSSAVSSWRNTSGTRT